MAIGNNKVQEKNLRPGKSYITTNHAAVIPNKLASKVTPMTNMIVLGKTRGKTKLFKCSLMSAATEIDLTSTVIKGKQNIAISTSKHQKRQS